MVGLPEGGSQALPPVVRNAMAQLGKVENFEVGQVLVQRGACAPSVYLIEDGQVEVTVDTAPPRAVGSGDVVGASGFLDGREEATVVAVTTTKARRIDAIELAQALATTPEVLHQVLDSIRTRRASRPDAVMPGREAVAAMAKEALAHRAVRHPYLTALGEGTVPDLRWALQDFARHYHGYSRMFPRYLTTVIAKLDDPTHRGALLENLTEESGTYEEDEVDELTALGIDRAWYEGIPHPQLFARFARALGVEPSVDDEADPVVCWREMFLDTLARGSAAQAVGALGLGTENIVSTMYQPLVKAVERAGLSGADAVFFPLHTAVDDGHQEVLQAIAASYAGTEAGQRDLRRGMIKALQCRSAFWDWLYERALARPRSEDAGTIAASAPTELVEPPSAEVQTLVRIARARRALGARTAAGEGFVRSYDPDAPQMYRNVNERLGIDFSVTRLAFEDLQTMDPRIVNIAPGANNELHKHAHESLFIVLEGEGEVRVGEAWRPLRKGDVAFVPRWIFHQTRNASAEAPLVLLAITDYGFTSAALGDYDRRTRLAAGGDQAAEDAAAPPPEVAPDRGRWFNRLFRG